MNRLTGLPLILIVSWVFSLLTDIENKRDQLLCFKYLENSILAELEFFIETKNKLSKSAWIYLSFL